MSLLSIVIKAALASAVGVLVAACAALPSFPSIWKEEVKLHDGRVMVVRRTQIWGERTFDGWLSLREHTLVFRPPGADRDITWRSEYREETAQLELLPIALDVVRGAPYVVTRPYRCGAYNRWGRPNPPYVAFRFEADRWQRIPFEAIPPEMGKTNLGQRHDEREIAEAAGMGIVPWRTIERENAYIQVRDLKFILREPVLPSERDSIVNCDESIPDGRGRWVSLGEFRQQPSHSACTRLCDLSRMTAAACPCDRLFEGK